MTQQRNIGVFVFFFVRAYKCQCTQRILSLIRIKEFTKYKKTGFGQFHLSTLKPIRQENKMVSEANRNQQQQSEEWRILE